MTARYIQETLQTPVRYSCDVVVAGGGTAGVCAALSAARNGAKTILVDRYNFLGGTMLNGAGPLHSFYNLYKAFPGAPKIQCVRGIPSEIVDRMIAADGSPGHLEQERGGDYDSVITIIDWEIFKDVIFDMLQEAGVRILLHCMIVGVIQEDRTLGGILIEGKSGREAIEASVVIDTTGDADVAAAAGVPFVKKHQTTKVGMPFGMLNVDMPRLAAFLEARDMITQIIRADKGIPTDDIMRLGFDLKKIPLFKEYMDQTGMWGPLGVSRYEGDYSFINSCSLPAVDATDTVILTDAEIKLRKQVHTLAGMLRAHIPGFEKARVYWTPASAGIRYTRCVACEYDISLAEIVHCARFDDEVMLYGFHDSAPRILIQNAGYYGLPYRALLPRQVESLLVAGRMITSDFDAHMSTRNTVSCMAQGEAVGAAAALAAKNGITPRALDPALLRATLRAQGVYLGD